MKEVEVEVRRRSKRCKGEGREGEERRGEERERERRKLLCE